MTPNNPNQSGSGDAGEPTTKHGARGPRVDRLRREFQEVFDLNLSEVRVLFALLQLGSANSSQIARVAQLPRTNTYPVMEALEEHGLVQRLPGDGVIEWTTPGVEAVIDRLDAAVEDAREAETRRHHARTRELRGLVGSAFPRIPAQALSDVQVIRGSARVKKLYEQMLTRAESELLMFTRPPYAMPNGYVNPAVIDMLARGVRTRVLYEEGLDTQDEFAVYNDAGVQARVVATVPLKVVIVDSRATLVGMPDLIEPEGYPTSLYVEHPAYATLLSMAFEHLWSTGRPYEPPEKTVDVAPRRRPVKRMSRS